MLRTMAKRSARSNPSAKTVAVVVVVGGAMVGGAWLLARAIGKALAEGVRRGVAAQLADGQGTPPPNNSLQRAAAGLGR